MAQLKIAIFHNFSSVVSYSLQGYT